MLGARRFWLIVLAVVVIFGAAACGGGDDKGVDVGADSTDATEATNEDNGDAAALFADEDCSFYMDALASNPFAAAAAGGAEEFDYSELGTAFQQIADKAPDELADDFEFLAGFYDEYAPVMQELMASGGQPEPETLAKLQELGQTVDQSKLEEASNNISTFFSEECGVDVGPTGG